MSAIYTGLLDIYYAKMTTEDTSAAAPAYDTPKVLGHGIEVSVTPRYKDGSQYASNRAVRRVSKIDGYDVSINPDQIDAAAREEILGRHVDSAGVHIITGDQQAPYVAIGFALTKDDGSRECWWLYKGKFSEMETAGKTEGESIEYQTPKLSAVFDRRMNDNALAAVADEEGDGVSAAVINGWFGTVYEKAAQASAPQNG